MDKKIIAHKLVKIRKAKKLTQRELAEKVGSTRSTISNYETGLRMPHLKDLQKLADVFGVGLDYFGVNIKDEAFNLLIRAKEVFESPEIDHDTKEELYREFMKLYLNLKDDKNGKG